MTLPRFTPVQPQSQPQRGPLPSFGQALTPPTTVQELATITGLNASVSTAVSTLGWAYTAMGVAYRCGTVTFTTTANIAANTSMFTVNFQHPFRNMPVAVCGGGPFCDAAFVASPSATSMAIFSVTAFNSGSGQTVQWIAIGV